MAIFMNTGKTLSRLALATLTFTLLLALGACSNSGAKAGAGVRGRGGDGGPVPVVVAKVSQRDVPINVDVIGNVEAYSTITVKAQVGGELTKVSFHEGDFVKKGDLLFTIDSRPYSKPSLARRKANLARDTAALSQAEANLARDIANEKYAQDQAKRYRGLFDQGVVSREQADQMTSSADALSQTVLADKAAIESARAQIVADKAAVGNGHGAVELHHHHFAHRRPHRQHRREAGQRRRRQYQRFDDHHPGAADLCHLLGSRGAAGRHQAVHGGRPLAGARRSAGRCHARRNRGVLTFIDNTVDATTGTIKLKGTFQNAEQCCGPANSSA